MDGGPGMAQTPPLGQSVRMLAHSALGYARVQLELVEVELNLERQRVESLVARTLALVVAALVAIQFAAMLVLALFWDTAWRVHATSALAVIAVVAAALAWREVQKLRRAASKRPVAAALHEIEQITAPLREDEA